MTAAPRIARPLATTLLAALLSTAIAILLALLCLIRENETGRIAQARCARLDLSAADRAAGRVPVRPATAVHSGAVRPACRRWSSPIWFSSCPMCSCRCPTPGAPMTAATRRSPPASARPAGDASARVALPMLLRAILTAAAVGFAVSVGLYLPTVLIGAGRLTPSPPRQWRSHRAATAASSASTPSCNCFCRLSASWLQRPSPR